MTFWKKLYFTFLASPTKQLKLNLEKIGLLQFYSSVGVHEAEGLESRGVVDQVVNVTPQFII